MPALRALNALALPSITAVTFTIFRHRNSSLRKAGQRSNDAWEWLHSALNIALFPPLFFFSGLYYTDVCSALSVLINHRLLLANQSSRGSSFLIGTLIALSGVLSLLFRQTNVFWVAVFPAAQAVVAHQETLFPRRGTVETKDMSVYNVVIESWADEKLFDCEVSDASFEGMPTSRLLYSATDNFRLYQSCFDNYCEHHPSTSHSRI